MAKNPIDQETMQEIVRLSQIMGDECVGKPVLVVQSAAAHLLAQIIMRNTNSQREAIKNIDGLCTAMKADVRVIYAAKRKAQN